MSAVESTAEGGRPLRADARRNRERVLAAAKEAIAEAGIEVNMSDIAQRAGVGVGTLYRHFETKEALIDALLVDHLERVLGVAESAGREDDPWSAFVGVLYFLADETAEDQCLFEVFEGRATASDEVLELKQKVYGAISALMCRAREAGVLRPDLAPGDLPLVLAGMRPARWLHGERGGDLGERYLTIVLDGLRAPGATPLPHRPLSKRELQELFTHRGGRGPRTRPPR